MASGLREIVDAVQFVKLVLAAFVFSFGVNLRRAQRAFLAGHE